MLIFFIQGFNTFGDVYGFVAANEVIAYAGNVIQQAVAEQGLMKDFVGIINDDFIVITHQEDIKGLAQAICERFNREVRAFYSFVDADRGGVLMHPGTPEESVAPLMQLRFAKYTGAPT